MLETELLAHEHAQLLIEVVFHVPLLVNVEGLQRVLHFLLKLTQPFQLQHHLLYLECARLQ